MCDEDPSGFCCRGAFEVFCEASAPAEPGEGTLDDPTARQQLEAFDAVRSLDDLDRPRLAVRESFLELLTAINPVGTDMMQLGEAASQPLQQGDSPMNILNVGGMDIDGQQKAVGVGDNMPLAPVNALAGIVSSRTAGLRSWRALTVNDRHRWPGFAP